MERRDFLKGSLAGLFAPVELLKRAFWRNYAVADGRKAYRDIQSAIDAAESEVRVVGHHTITETIDLRASDGFVLKGGSVSGTANPLMRMSLKPSERQPG